MSTVVSLAFFAAFLLVGVTCVMEACESAATRHRKGAWR